MKKINIFVYGGETQHNGTWCGANTQARIKRAIKLIQEILKEDPYAQICTVFAAGQNTDEPTYPPLKEIMKDFFLIEMRKTFHPTDSIWQSLSILLAPRQAWKTLPETIEALKTIEKNGDGDIYAVSSNDHLWRIKFIWKWISNKKVHYIGVPSTRSLMHQILYEGAAILLTFRKLLILTIRQKLKLQVA